MKTVGLETPEQIGALFIGDSEFLEELTRGIEPVVDNFPKRIMADSVLGQGKSLLFTSLKDTDAARERFVQSQLIRELWPEPLIQRTIPYFDYQRIIDDLIDVSGHPLTRDMNDLHHILTETSITGPALWHMGSTADVQASLAGLSTEERALPLWQYQIGAGLFAERRYLEAEEPLRRAEDNQVLFATARLFRIYGLCLDSQVDAARDLAQQSYPALAGNPRIEHWWDFLAREYGVDPRPDVSNQ